MNVLNFLFRKKKALTNNAYHNNLLDSDRERNSMSGKENANRWSKVPQFIESNSCDYELVSVIGACLAAERNPESSFVIKRILTFNPEVELVSIVATSIATRESLAKKVVIKKIYTNTNRDKDIELGDLDVKKI